MVSFLFLFIYFYEVWILYVIIPLTDVYNIVMC
jgi:hypothetical protein